MTVERTPWRTTGEVAGRPPAAVRMDRRRLAAVDRMGSRSTRRDQTAARAHEEQKGAGTFDSQNCRTRTKLNAAFVRFVKPVASCGHERWAALNRQVLKPSVRLIVPEKLSTLSPGRARFGSAAPMDDFDPVSTISSIRHVGS